MCIYIYIYALLLSPSQALIYMGERRGAYRILVGKPEGKTTWKTQSRWKDNMKMDLQETALDRSGSG